MSALNQNLVSRLWQKDVTLWRESGSSTEFLASRLGWLDTIEWMETHIPAITDWAKQIVKSEKFDQIILLGMGGSSLAPEVFSSVFENQVGYPGLIVLDTTSPAQIDNLALDLKQTLFIASSKSGTTVETADLYAYFYSNLQQVMERPGDNFVAITDPDSWLHHEAVGKGFVKVFLNPADIGGRYSALSYFGLVPAALIGVDLKLLFERTSSFADSIKSDDIDNSVYRLARLMGDNAESGKNKMKLNIAKPFASLAVWIEQLVAESTGKDGKGIIPIVNQTGLPSSQNVSDDQFSVCIDSKLQENSEREECANMAWVLTDRYDLGSEFLCWEMATALAASIMKIDPFDQLNVEEAKHRTQTFLNGSESHSFINQFEDDNCMVFFNFPAPVKEKLASIISVFDEFSKQMKGTAYLAILGYLPNFGQVDTRLSQIQILLEKRFQTTTTRGYGPRYLHSTGQLHKGGPTSGSFLQITEQSHVDIPIPERKYSFGDLHCAQADGDYSVLERKGLPIMRITLKADRLKGLDSLINQL